MAADAMTRKLALSESQGCVISDDIVLFGATGSIRQRRTPIEFPQACDKRNRPFSAKITLGTSRKGEGRVMKTLIGGAVAAALGLIGLGFWWKEFLTVLGGTIPAVLLLGGGLAIYLGFDEMKDTWKKDEPVASAVTADELEKYKSEISDLKRELDGLKADKKSD
jgi:hypothetical protein